MTVLEGGCYCGAVRWRSDRAAPRPVTFCHCSQCRRLHGHVAAFATLPNTALTITKPDGLAWYEASPRAARGFCSICGTRLFWREHGGQTTEVAAGSFDDPSVLTEGAHIWCADKAAWYALGADGLPRYAGDPPG